MVEPVKSIYALVGALEEKLDMVSMSSFGFPAADIAACGASHGNAL
jgi:microcystin degradation protein MlrC